VSDEGPAEQTVATTAQGPDTPTGERPRRLSDIYQKARAKPATPASWQSLALNGVFLIAIALPLAGMLLGLDSAFVLVENRVLAPRPELKPGRASLAEFPAGFEAYFNDQFGFRKRMIHWLNIIKVVGLGVSPSSRVVLGQNGWLFHGELYLDYYRSGTPFTQRKLEMWRRLLESRRDWLASRGIPYLVVFVPIKSTIYPEYMPRVYNRLRAESRLDQLESHLKRHSTLTYLDLRAPLLAAKSARQIYYRTDTHWNNRGAQVGYARITDVLSSWFPQIEAIPRSEFREEKLAEPGRNLAQMLAMSDFYRDEFSDLKLTSPTRAHPARDAGLPGGPARKPGTGGPDIVYEHPDKKLPRAVMFRDSFATWLIPLLSEHFQRIIFSWQYSMDRELVEREHPDVVIQELAERALMNDPLPSQ
jgi:alginate O-acetyltransferase complex protein AlgJ